MCSDLNALVSSRTITKWDQTYKRNMSDWILNTK